MNCKTLSGAFGSQITVSEIRTSQSFVSSGTQGSVQLNSHTGRAVNSDFADLVANASLIYVCLAPENYRLPTKPIRELNGVNSIQACGQILFKITLKVR